jgi:hypothetical protein
LLGNHKSPGIQDDAAESDLGDLDEDGKDGVGQDSVLDANDKDKELADLMVDNFDNGFKTYTAC